MIDATILELMFFIWKFLAAFICAVILPMTCSVIVVWIYTEMKGA